MPGIAGTAALPPTLMKTRSAASRSPPTSISCGRDEPGVAAIHGAVLRRAQRRLGRGTPRRDDGVLALLHPPHVHRDAAADHDTEVGGAARHVRGIGAGDQGLGRRAAGVDAGPAERLALDDGDALSGAGEPLRERRAGLAAADDDRVIRSAWCPLRSWPLGRRTTMSERIVRCQCRWFMHLMLKPDREVHGGAGAFVCRSRLTRDCQRQRRFALQHGWTRLSRNGPRRATMARSQDQGRQPMPQRQPRLRGVAEFRLTACKAAPW